MKCRDLIDQWHDCRTYEKNQLKDLYKFATIRDVIEKVE
jgi:hypothetical protein